MTQRKFDLQHRLQKNKALHSDILGTQAHVAFRLYVKGKLERHKKTKSDLLYQDELICIFTSHCKLSYVDAAEESLVCVLMRKTRPEETLSRRIGLEHVGSVWLSRWRRGEGAAVAAMAILF